MSAGFIMDEIAQDALAGQQPQDEGGPDDRRD